LIWRKCANSERSINVLRRLSMFDFQALADYFQKQADRTRDPERKAHYQRCADEYRAKAKEAECAPDKPIPGEAPGGTGEAPGGIGKKPV
jgi:hypothetical protein